MQLSLCSVCGHLCYCTSVVAVDDLVAVFVSHCIYNYVILSESNVKTTDWVNWFNMISSTMFVNG